MGIAAQRSGYRRAGNAEFLEGYDLVDGSRRRIPSSFAEAKTGFCDRAKFYADPEFNSLPVSS